MHLHTVWACTWGLRTKNCAWLWRNGRETLCAISGLHSKRLDAKELKRVRQVRNPFNTPPRQGPPQTSDFGAVQIATARICLTSFAIVGHIVAFAHLG